MGLISQHLGTSFELTKLVNGNWDAYAALNPLSGNERLHCVIDLNELSENKWDRGELSCSKLDFIEGIRLSESNCKESEESR
ncbi:hypothetical protein TNCV_2447771 [Trichonephila clavipes]|uniref:Uncharacterized protein n=1 Tax=Trichonephila clavipes TaxID=2585209 RepID=A0A8X6SI22_TRICX|nr:hypothetical protein TNCV_2447771 [Trichonephila clavipes]